MKKLIFLSAMLFLTLAVIELMALFADRLLHDETDTLAADAPEPRFAESTVKEVLHPFYGHVLEPRRQTLNIMPPPPRQEGAFVIALLGSSVAKNVAREFRNALIGRSLGTLGTEALELEAGIAPVLVDLTNTGSHQPFQAVALANMIANGGQFDAIVVVDGYNEIADVPNHLLLGLYPLFPRFWSSLTAVTPVQRAIIGRIGKLRQEQQELLRASTAGLLRHSAVFRLIRRFRMGQAERLLVFAHHELTAASVGKHHLEKHGPRRAYREDELGQIGTESWYLGALLMARLAERHGAEYYHFLQPNQHVPDTKKLSADELALVRRASYGSREVVWQAYPRLRQYGGMLRDQGFKFFDLSWIYEDHPETLYIDPCCHVNKRGNELLAAAIVRRIVAEGGLGGGAGSLTPVGRGVFDVYDVGTYLAYSKVPCQLADTSATFFLHVMRTPEDDLDPSRPSRRREEHDFQFRRFGTVFGDRCVATVELGDWHNATLRTGQLAGDGVPAWSVDFVHSRYH